MGPQVVLCQKHLVLGDPPQDIAESITQARGASGKILLRKGKMQQDRERSEENNVRNSPVNTKTGEEGAGGDAPGARAEIPLQAVKNHGII